MNTEEYLESEYAKVEELRSRLSETCEGEDLFNCMSALLELTIEILFEMNDASPQEYDPFTVYRSMFDDTLRNAKMVTHH